jgi:hypothetical protein
MLFRVMLCLCVLGSHAHCVLTHGAELLADQAQRHADVECPIGETQPCGNESSCICKGATLGDGSVAFLVPDDLVNWLSCLEAPRLLEVARVADCDRFVGRLGPPAKPGGTTARALLQSFQI